MEILFTVQEHIVRRFKAIETKTQFNGGFTFAWLSTKLCARLKLQFNINSKLQNPERINMHLIELPRIWWIPGSGLAHYPDLKFEIWIRYEDTFLLNLVQKYGHLNSF